MVLFKYLRFFIFGLIVAVYSTPLKDLSARQGSCVSLFRGRPLEEQLPPVVLSLTDHFRTVTTFSADGDDWNQNFEQPGHTFRWRAWRGQYTVVLQVQALGNIGVNAILRVVAPRTDTMSDYIGGSNANGNGGGTDQWGDTVCLALPFPPGRDAEDPSVTYTADINLGNMF